MRALYTVVISLAVAGSAIPGYGLPFWHKHNAPVTAQLQSPPISAPVENSLIAQSNGPAPGTAPRPHLNGPGPHQGDWLRQFSTLPPAQQEQKLQNDPVFRSLTPEKQQHLLDRLRNFNSLAPDKKQKILNRMETYEHLPPEKQAQAQTLFQQYQGLPADQRSQVSQAYRKLRQMSPEQRTQFFNSDEFHSNFNDEQRDLLRGMAELYPSQVH
jgi:Protein of unknown function (DUF3106)